MEHQGVPARCRLVPGELGAWLMVNLTRQVLPRLNGPLFLSSSQRLVPGTFTASSSRPLAMNLAWPWAALVPGNPGAGAAMPGPVG